MPKSLRQLVFEWSKTNFEKLLVQPCKSEQTNFLIFISKSFTGWYTGSSQSNWKNIWNADEEVVKQWVAEVGPVVTTIYASGEFGSYSGGVLNARDCCNQSEDPSCRYMCDVV